MNSEFDRTAFWKILGWLMTDPHDWDHVDSMTAVSLGPTLPISGFSLREPISIIPTAVEIDGSACTFIQTPLPQ